MSDEVTDPNILRQLNAPAAAAPPSDDVTDPSVLAQLNNPGTAGHGASMSWQPHDAMSFLDQVGVAKSDNFDEKELYFKNKYGKQAVSREWGDDGRPALVVNAGGKTFRVGEAGFVAQLTADSPKLIGMAAGGIVGFGLGGPLGAAGGAAVGSAAGKALIEGQKSLEGNRFKKTMGEDVSVSLNAAKEGAEGEAGGRVLGNLAGRAMTAHLPKFITGATDKSLSQVKDAWLEGARPSYRSMAPDLKKLQRTEAIADRISGAYISQIDRNKAYITAHMKDTMTANGIPPDFVDRIAQEIDGASQTVSHTALGEDIKSSVKAHVDAMNSTIEKTGKVADSHIDSQMENINRVIDSTTHGHLAPEVEKQILSAKKDFESTARDIYGRINTLLGGAPVVSTDFISDVAKSIVSQKGPDIVGKIVRQAAHDFKKPNIGPDDAVLLSEFGISMPTEGKISIEEAQRWRTTLRKKGRCPNLTHNMMERDYLRLAEATDDAIQGAADHPAAKPAVDALNHADKWYRENIRKFGDTQIKSMLKNIQSGAPPDPENIVKVIATVGKSARTTQLRTMLGPETWRKVQSVHLNDFMIRMKSDTAGGASIDGQKILSSLSGAREQRSFEAVHGTAETAQMREIGRMLAARMGKVPVEELASGNVKAALMKMQAQKTALDDWMKTNALSALATDGKGAEEAYQWVARPGAETEPRTVAVAKTFGENSPQIAGMRQAALEEIARNSTSEMIEKGGNSGIKKALGAYTPAQTKILFPDGLDKDLKAVSDVIEFMYPRESGIPDTSAAPSLTAGAILNRSLPVRLPIQATFSVMRMFVLSPKVARWIVTGREFGEFAWQRKTAALIEKMSAGGFNEGIGKLDNMQSQNTSQPTQMPAPQTVQ